MHLCSEPNLTFFTACHQMSAAFDEGGARGLLLNHLNTRGDAALVFDSQDCLAEVKPSVPSDTTADNIAQLIGM